ncbi:MAG: hypothetical protein JW750_01190 [Anaerolineaceae bacterium]|nr:hypothetical protein [Anaerolineaceae bacterium]
MEKIRLGFVPTFRFAANEWCMQMRRSGIEQLRQIDAVELVFPQTDEEGVALPGIPSGAINTLDQAEVLSDYFIQQKVDAILICPLDFGDERASVKVAERLRLPTMLYATKEPPVPAGVSMARVSDSYCGTLSIAAGLKRRGIPFHFGGIFFHEDPEFRSAVDTFIRAVSVVKAMRGARVGQVGQRPASFETVAYDEVAMAKQFGQNVVHADLSQITRVMDQLADDSETVLKVFDSMEAELDEISINPFQIIQMAKLELALKQFCQQNHLSALAMQCWPNIQQMIGVSTCAVFGRLTNQGYLTACEADVVGALSMLAQYAGALGKTPPHFIDWTIRHREDPNQFLAWHCGNAPVSLARPDTMRALRSRYDMTGSAEQPDEDDPQAGLYQFQLMPGEVSICRLAEYDGVWKMLIASGEIVPSDDVLAGTWSWVRVKDHDRLYRTLVEEGFIHHASMIHMDQRAVLELACKFLGIKTVIVD